MRSKDYTNAEDSFTPLEPHEMVRVALIEGMRKKYRDKEHSDPDRLRKKWTRLVEQFTEVPSEDIWRFYRILGQEKLSPKQWGLLQGMFKKLDYKSDVWKPFDYKELFKGEDPLKHPVIVQHKGDIGSLVELMAGRQENQVVFTECRIVELGIDYHKKYVKHVHQSHILTINGPDVIKAFAENEDFELPENYLRNPYEITNEVYNLLIQHGFTFKQALKTLIDDVIKMEIEKYANRKASMLRIKHFNGNELRMHHHDFIEAAELLLFLHKNGQTITQTLGNLLDRYSEPKYHGLNVFEVPERIPDDGPDIVQAHYLPDFGLREGIADRRVLEWMHTNITCDCEHGFNLRNFQLRRGKRTYVVPTQDTHAGAVILRILNAKGYDFVNNEMNLNPVPTKRFSRGVDKYRYNLAVWDGNKPSDARYAHEPEIEILINERLKDTRFTFDKIYQPRQPLTDFLLRPMYQQ